jgi:hypothetical protein
MRSVDRRLRKLEAVARAREWIDPFSKLEPLALAAPSGRIRNIDFK